MSLAFVGSAALACWGGYMMLTALENRDPSRRISELMNVTYSMQLLAGMLVFTMGAYFFAERATQWTHRESMASPGSELDLARPSDEVSRRSANDRRIRHQEHEARTSL